MSEKKKCNDFKFAHELGMNKPIPRRDFLHGIMGASLSLMLPLAGCQTASSLAHNSVDVYSPEKEPGYYPPSLTGLRGSQPGSFEVAHSRSWSGKNWNDPEDLDERYDLIVVGGGVSGLAAAYAYREKAGTDARILIVENHDDFGGHARRNEFHIDG